MLHSSCFISLSMMGLLFFIGIAKAQLPDDDVDVAMSDNIAHSVMKFALNLVQKMNADYHKTLIFSPLSIMAALAMLLLGAKGRSYAELTLLFGQSDMVKLHEQFGLMLKDAQQPVRETTSPLRELDPWHSDSLRRSLRPYPENRNDIQVVQVANGLFIQQGYSINPDYRQALTLNYKSEVYPVDYESDPHTAKTIINSWVNQQTKGKIAEIITDEIDATTRMVLANTLYFKASWELDFLGGESRKQNFYPNGVGNEPVLTVLAMVGLGAYPYYEDPELNCRIVGIPYHGNMSAMYVIQPLTSSVEQLAALQQKLTVAAIDRMIGNMKRVSAIVVFPKMHLTESARLRDLLQSMGIGGIFNPVQYDLSLIVEGEQNASPYHPDAIGSLKNLVAQREAAPSDLPTSRAALIISEIVHKVDFNVDEKGTEAAAASAAILTKSGPDMNILVETPFILLVRNDITKLPLFYGIINEPPSLQSNEMYYAK